MNSLLKKCINKGKTTAITVSIICGILCLISIVMAMTFASDDEGSAVPYATVFDTVEEGDYVSITANFASDSVASFVENDEVNFYLIFESDYYGGLNCYLVCGDNSLYSKLIELQDYTYDYISEEPEPVTLAGRLVPIDPELVEYAVPECDYLFGEGVIPKDEFYDYFGYYYIDTTQTAADSGLVTFLVIVALILLGVIIFVWYRRMQVTACTRNTRMMLGDGAFQSAGAELNDETANRTYAGMQAVLTNSYVVCYAAGPQIVPIQDIAGIHGIIHSNKGALCFVLRSGYKVVFPSKNTSKQQIREEYRDLIGRISEKNRDIYYGKDRLTFEFEDRVDINTIKNFYLIDTTKGVTLNDSDLTTGEIVTPDYGAGIIGAIGGAVLGMIAWIIVGMLGFISGWIGALTIYLAMRGFKKLAGALDKKGAVISTVIAVIAVPLATALGYVIALVQAGSHITFFYALTHLFQLLELYDAVGSFAKELIMGLLFTLLIGIPIAHSSLKQTSQRVVTDANGKQVYVPDVQGVRDETGNYFINTGNSYKASMIICLVFGILFIFGGIVSMVSESVVAVFFLIMGLFFLFMGIIVRKQGKQSITYNEQGITYNKSKNKVIQVSWSQVTELKFANVNGLTIVAPEGKIVFSRAWKNYEHLMAYAVEHAVNIKK